MQSESTKRTLLAKAALIMLGVLIPLLFLEITLRFFPVNDGLRTLPVNEASPVLRRTPNRNSTWSRDWNFSIVNQVHTNNYGFVSDVDYDPNAPQPLLAVIGDSYVEALMVPYNDTVTAQLARSLKPTARAYAFGASGSSLSQYLAYAQYARDTFHPVGMVMVITNNDFDESLLKYRNAPGLHYFAETNGHLELVRVDYQPGLLGTIASESKLFMYLNSAGIWQNIQMRRKQAADSANPHRLPDSRRAVDAFFELLPAMTGLDSSQILFVVDGIRPSIYNNIPEAEQDSYFAAMRLCFISTARSKGYEIVDMQVEFRNHYQQYGQKFEFPTDGHWNSIGHEVAADAIERSKLYAQFASPK